MTSRQNPFQHIASDLAKELTQSRSRAKSSKIIPFGMEQVSRREALNHMQTMTRADLEAMPQEQYQSLVESVGQEAVMEVINRENSAQSGGFL